MSSFFQATCQGYVLKLLVSPGASRSEVVGLHGDRLKVRLAARPQKGAANQELLAFLSELLKVSKNSLKITGGAQSRAKVVAVLDLSADLRHRLQNLVIPAA
jgi:uncharacterized protein (TIGR00251 family)